MKTIKIKKADWTDEEIEIKLSPDGNYGIIPELDLLFYLKNPKNYGNTTTYSVTLHDKGSWIETDWIAETDHHKGYHTASIWNGAYLRESMEDVRYSVAKLIFSVYSF